MLPSTGYFKAINCPFYENGYCERPYCHFRHTRPNRDVVVPSTATTTQVSQDVQKPQNASSTAVAATTPTVIEHLVSEAVKKVLAEQTLKDTEKIVNKVVEGLKPQLVPAVISSAPTVSKPSILVNDPIVAQHGNLPMISTSKPSKCVYNPTPISELQRRHIPVPSYQPSKESRAVKRKSPEIELPWMDVIRNVNKKESTKVGYTPTSFSYAPSVQSYEERRAEKRRRRKEKDSYRPKQKKRREEYVPRRPKVPLKDKQPLDDDVDVFNDIFGETDPKTSITIDDDSPDLMEVEPKFSDDESAENITKDDDSRDKFPNTASDDRGASKLDKEYDIEATIDYDSSNHSDREHQSDHSDNEDHRSDRDERGKSDKHAEFSNYDKNSSSKSKSSEKSGKEDPKHSKHNDKEKEGSRDSRSKDDSKTSKSKENDWRNVKIKEEGSRSSQSKDEDDSKASKSKENDWRNVKIKEEGSKSSKSKDGDDSKTSKSKENDWRNVKIKEEGSKSVKSRDEDSKYSKSKEKDRESDRKDKEKDKSKEKDKHKQSSKSSDKERSSSSKDSKGKERDRDKEREKEREREREREREKEKEKEKDRDKDKNRDSKKSKDSSHHVKKESKSEKERSSSKDSKDKGKSRSDDKHKSKSSSTDSKSKSSSRHSHKSSDEPGSHSSHKYGKSNVESSVDSQESSSEEQMRTDVLSDHEKKLDSPEYEEFSPIFDEQLLETDSDYDVEEECRKIFQEYEVDDVPKHVSSKAPSKPELEEFEEVSRKRVAHSSSDASLIKQVGPSQPVKRSANPQQRMYERWRLMKELAAQKSAEKEAANVKSAINNPLKKVAQSSSTDHQVNGNGRIRIAGVPYAMSLALEKKKVMAQAAKVETKTVAQTKKGGRVAHIPQSVPQLIRPEPLNISGTQKFPLNVRQFYVNAMQDICIQIYDSHEDAVQRAVQEELACYERCKAVNVYKNSCMLTVHRLRKEVDQKTTDQTASFSGLISHEAVLAGKVKGSWSVVKQKKPSSVEIKGTALYCMLRKWIMTEQDLKDNGYPRPHPDGPKGRAKLYVANSRGQSTLSKVPNERICCRCHKPYYVDKHGFPLRKENCIYHYARKFTFRGETKYMCCKQDGSSDGCCDATTHVWDHVDVENLRGYVTTFDKDIPPDEHGVYALDCEMCYTTQGLELTRVTVIDENLQVVYESLVKPSNRILDYNTRFSGITEEDMENVSTTLLDVQATFLSMFSSKTILIGHSLESDFKALKLIHSTVVDTSIMFPHKNGPPFKRALRNLVSELLRRIIQNDVGGHDSKEDALACMELVLWKIKEELKLQ